MARLCPLFSGSTGNSYYIGTRSAGLLLDAGRSARQLVGALQRCGIDPLAVQGILITHEHSDHIAGVRVFAKKYGIPVFASQGTLLAMDSSLEGVERWVLEEELQLAGMTVRPFSTPHDSAQSLGFRIRTEDGRQFALATDLGALTGCVREHLLGAEFVVIECQPRQRDAPQRALSRLSQAAHPGGDGPPLQRGVRGLPAGAGPGGNQAVPAGPFEPGEQHPQPGPGSGPSRPFVGRGSPKARISGWG